MRNSRHIKTRQHSRSMREHTPLPTPPIHISSTLRKHTNGIHDVMNNTVALCMMCPKRSFRLDIREICSLQSHLLEVKNSGLLSYPPSLSPLSARVRATNTASLWSQTCGLTVFFDNQLKDHTLSRFLSYTSTFTNDTHVSWTFFRRTPRQLNRRSCPSCKGHVYGKLRSCKQDVRRR